jgi:Mrp family chromosome partitioning ATPase
MFIGREVLLQELDSIVRDAVENPLDRTQCRIVISGVGGQGKSEICLQLAHRLQQMWVTLVIVRDLLIEVSRFWGVFWIDVSTTDLAERSFLDVAQKLSMPAQTWEDARLGITDLKRPSLLVLDMLMTPMWTTRTTSPVEHYVWSC